MKDEKITNIEVVKENDGVETVAEVTEVKSESFGSKLKAGFKKHGKKIAAGAALTAAALVGYVVGKKHEDDLLIDDIDVNNIEEVDVVVDDEENVVDDVSNEEE